MTSTTTIKATTLMGGLLLLLATTAWAHPDHDRPRTLNQTAYALKEVTQNIHYAAEERFYYSNKRRVYALEKLHHLKRQAKRFHRKVKSGHPYGSRSRAEYRELKYAYREARHAINQFQFRQQKWLKADFRHVTRLMEELSYFYDDYRWNNGRRGHGSHGPAYCHDENRRLRGDDDSFHRKRRHRH